MAVQYTARKNVVTSVLEKFVSYSSCFVMFLQHFGFVMVAFEILKLVEGNPTLIFHSASPVGAQWDRAHKFIIAAPTKPLR